MPGHAVARSVGVIVATKGRPEQVGGVLESLEAQRVPPDRVLVVGTEPSDLPDELPGTVERVLTQPGTAHQRNVGLDLLASRVDVVLFLDDDVELADDYIAHIAEAFAQPGVVGAHGDVLADGMRTGCIERDAGRGLLARSGPALEAGVRRTRTLYGCNMAAAAATAAVVRFDEHLSAYGWLEDRDFSARLARHGRLVQAPAARAVHLGFTGGRMAGEAVGYTQIVNPWYLRRKGTIGLSEVLVLWGRALLGNLRGHVRPDSRYDRPAQLRGLLRGLAAVARRRTARTTTAAR